MGRKCDRTIPAWAGSPRRSPDLARSDIDRNTGPTDRRKSLGLIMNIDMALNAQRNNVQRLRVVGVIVVFCLFAAMGTSQSINSWESSFLNSKRYDISGFVFIWITIFLYFIMLTDLFRIFFGPYLNSGICFLRMLFTIFLSTLFTFPTMAIFSFFAFTKFAQWFNLSAFITSLIHLTPHTCPGGRRQGKKIPAALRSSSKRQAGNILTHNALARPIAFDCFNYSI